MNRSTPLALPALAFLAAVCAGCDYTEHAPDEGWVPDAIVYPDLFPEVNDLDAISPDPGDADADPGGVADIPGHPHPYWANATWDGLKSAAEEGAQYQVVSLHEQQLELAGMVRDGTSMPTHPNAKNLTRLAFGSLKAGEEAALGIFFDAKTPWRAKVKGTEVYWIQVIDPDYQFFDTPIEIPMDLPVGQTESFDASVRTRSSMMNEKVVSAHYEVRAISYQAACHDGADAPRTCAVLRVTISGDLVGGTPLDSEVTMHPTRGLVKWINAPGFVSIVLSDLASL